MASEEAPLFWNTRAITLQFGEEESSPIRTGSLPVRSTGRAHAPDQVVSNSMQEPERTTFDRIIYSNWFAWLVLALAGFSVGLLYFKGRTTEAVVGAAVLLVAAVLIFFGSRSE